MDKNTNARLSQANIASSASLTAARTAGTPATPAGQPPPPGVPDVTTMIRRVLAHWPVILVTMTVGAVVTTQVVRLRKAMYKSETVIVYREGISRSISGPGEGGENLRSLGTKLKETLLAQQTLRRVIDEFHLYPDVVAKSGYADAVDRMRKKTEFKSRSQDTFAISFEGYDRDQAQKVCARLADVLVAENARRVQDEQKGTAEFLEAEKTRADEELTRLEREISTFLQAHPEFATARDGLGTEVLALRNKAEEEEKRRNRAKPHGPRRGTAAPAAGGVSDERAPAVDPVLLSARSQALTDLLAAKKDLADKSARFTEQHPDVRAAQERVAVAEDALRRAEDAVAQATPKDDAPRKKVVIDDPYADSTARPAAPVAPLPDPDAEGRDKAKPKADPDQANKVVTLEMEWARLNRAHSLAKAHQADLETKLYRAEMIANTVEAGYGTSIVILDPAYKPSGPSNAPNRTVVAIGLAASIAVGVVLSAAWGLFLDDRLFAPSEIETSVMVPVLGVIPRDDRKEGKGKRGSGKTGGKPGAGPQRGLSRA